MSDFSEPFILMTKALAESGAWATHKEWDKALKSLDDAVAFSKGYRVGLVTAKQEWDAAAARFSDVFTVGLPE